MNGPASNEALVNKMVGEGTLKTQGIAEAFRHMDRANFVLPEYKNSAYNDRPLPIHSGQTISQPTTVAFMLELLQPQHGEKILDVGSGSGWTTALLAYLVSYGGFVHGVELMPTLVEFGTQNLKRMQMSNSNIHKATSILGYPKEAPYDRILVSAFSNDVPQELVDQLKVGGRMVMPVMNSIFKIDKISQDKIEIEENYGFVFVPLIKVKK